MSHWIDPMKELPPVGAWVQVVWGTCWGMRIGGPPVSMVRPPQIRPDRMVWWHYAGDFPTGEGVVLKWRHLHPEPKTEEEPSADPGSLDGE
jgi:hypothetical protein